MNGTLASIGFERAMLEAHAPKPMRLVQTCQACPEQYDVFNGDTEVGYLRLRHGYFAAYRHVTDYEPVYEANPKGDGIFELDERDQYLTAAVHALGGTDYTVEVGWD